MDNVVPIVCSMAIAYAISLVVVALLPWILLGSGLVAAGGFIVLKWGCS